MEGITTREDLDAQRWYLDEDKHHFRLDKETKLEYFSRFMGLNQLISRPSDEEILRMYRLKKGEISKMEYWTKNICEALDYIGLGKAVRWITLQDYEEAKEESTNRVISMIPYGR